MIPYLTSGRKWYYFDGLSDRDITRVASRIYDYELISARWDCDIETSRRHVSGTKSVISGEVDHSSLWHDEHLPAVSRTEGTFYN